MGVDFRGAAGRVRWSYHVAAVVGKFSIAGGSRSKPSKLRAQVVSADPFQVRQTPLVFELTNGSGLRWPLVDVVLKDGLLTATIDE